MKYFFLDTSNSHLIIAIYKNKKRLAYYNEIIGRDLSSQIMVIINDMFKQANITPWDINKIFVVTGPGSFTGIRIGVTFAKTFAWACKIDIVPISSLELLATTNSSRKLIVPIIDARRNYVYAGLYDKNLNQLEKDQYISIDNLFKKIGNKKVTFISYDKFELIKKIKYPNVQILKIIKKYFNSESVVPHELNPCYLKLTEAEEKLKNDSKSVS